jgi:hypothetical protein
MNPTPTDAVDVESGPQGYSVTVSADFLADVQPQFVEIQWFQQRQSFERPWIARLSRIRDRSLLVLAVLGIVLSALGLTLCSLMLGIGGFLPLPAGDAVLYLWGLLYFGLGVILFAALLIFRSRLTTTQIAMWLSRKVWPVMIGLTMRRLKKRAPFDVHYQEDGSALLIQVPKLGIKKRIEVRPCMVVVRHRSMCLVFAGPGRMRRRGVLYFQEPEQGEWVVDFFARRSCRVFNADAPAAV